MNKIRCKKYSKLLLELEGKAEIICNRCKTKKKNWHKKTANHLHEIENWKLETEQYDIKK